MRHKICVALILACLFAAAPSWAFIDGIVSGARAVKDEAHQKIMENEIIQLVITAKKNYDASMQIYKQVKQLNEGKGLIKNISSDLGHRAGQMRDEEKDAFESALTYRGDSTLDRKIEEYEIRTRRAVARSGNALVDSYGDAVNAKSAAYLEALKKQGRQLIERKKRGEAAKGEGVKIASMAPDLNGKTQGLQLQAFSDSVEALNQLVAIEAMRDARRARQEIATEKEIAESLKFLAERDGAAKALEESFYLVRLSRAPGLLATTRQAVSRMVAMLLGLILAGALIYEFSQGRGIVPETLGLPLVLVMFGLLFYDKIFVSFAVVVDAIEQTVTPNNAILLAAGQNSSQASTLGVLLQGSLKWLAIALGYANWLVVIVFLWMRFAFFCLIYAVGPIFIALGLFEPLRNMTKGWMQAAVQVALWGLFMRVLVFVVLNSNAANLDPAGGVIKPMFATFVVALVFLMFSVICPYFTHHLVSGHIAGQALATVSAGKAGTFKGVKAYTYIRDAYQGKQDSGGKDKKR